MSVITMLFAFSFVNAQETRPAPKNATETAVSVQDANGDYIEMFRRDLSVNDDQIGRIRVLHTETINKYNTIDPKYLQNEDLHRNYVRDILNDRDERLRTILTPDQYQKYDQNRFRYSVYDSDNFPYELNRRNVDSTDRIRNPEGAKPTDGAVPANNSPANLAKPADGAKPATRPAETSPVTNPQIQNDQQK